MTWGASSSGVEQLFSVLKRSPAELASSKADTDRRLAVVAGACLTGDEDEIVSKARSLYSKLLASGKARTSVRKTRLDAKTSGLKFRKASEKEWARKRSEAIRKATEQSADLTTPPRRPPRELPESLAKEVRNQEKQTLKRKAEAFLDGALLPEEATPEVVQAAQKKEKADMASDKTRRKNFLTTKAALVRVARKETYTWALQNLPSPAFFVSSVNNNEKRRWANLLAKAGVPAITDESWLFLIQFFFLPTAIAFSVFRHSF